MNQPLYMVQMELDETALVRFLNTGGLNLTQDEDLGYGLHAWLAASFGPLAPKPFRLVAPRHYEHRARLLAYASCDGDALREQAELFALPAAQAVCDLTAGLATAVLPTTDRFAVGRRLGFEVLCCPVARRAADGRERDVFLHAADHAGDGVPIDRSRIYVDWLSRQLEPGASLEEARMEEFALVSQLRQRHGDGREGRRKTRLTRPRVLLRGTLAIRDSQAFRETLRRGVGRHRAFGYGMLLLRPAS